MMNVQEITPNVQMTVEVKNDLDWIIEECLDFVDFGWMIANGQGIGTSDMSILYNDIYAAWRKSPFAATVDYDMGYVRDKVEQYIEYMEFMNDYDEVA